jgi:gamma-glutamyltranspeptidase/glutathione hydrolase
MLDCFVAVPGLGGDPRAPRMLELQIPFGAELVHYAVGPATCAVPGLPAGLDALWRAHGRLPWPRLVEPALAVARAGAELPPAHAACLEMLAPVMTMNEGAGIYAPGGELLRGGARVAQPNIGRALELVADEGPGTVYSGTIAGALLELSRRRGGRLTERDLSTYEAGWSEPDTVDYAGARISTRTGLSGLPQLLARLPALRGRSPSERVVSLTEAFAPAPVAGGSHTTALAVADGDGNACALISSLGLGSGDWLPGLDLHLNSMLGEADLIRGPLEPGARMESMMSPTLAHDRDGRLLLVGGAAGGTRIRTALAGVLAGVLDEGLPAEVAVARPRFHAAATTVNAEPGVDEDGLAELERRGWAVRRWDGPHHYFGGVSLITRDGAAGDPRRSGAARVLD